jgi:hypothetical protein
VEQLAGFLDFENFASLIVPALGASAMWHFLFMAVGALGKAVAFERVVRPPGRGAPLRMTSFWIWHGLIPLFNGRIRPIRDRHSALDTQPIDACAGSAEFKNSHSKCWLNADG